MHNKIDKIARIMPSLRRYAFALAGTESGADQVLEGALELLLADSSLEEEHLEDCGVEGCRIAWLEAEHRDFRRAGQAHRTRQSLERIDTVDISRAMDDLTTFQRKCLIMSTIGNKSYSEISSMENISTAKVNDYISQARAAFIKRFFGASSTLREGLEGRAPSFERYSGQHLNALLDNELDSTESARVRGALSVDQQMAKKLEELVLVDTLILSNFAVIEDDPVLTGLQTQATHTSAYLH